MRIDIVSLFPDMVENLLQNGVIGRAIKNNHLIVETWNPRNYASGEYRAVDDRPYGGGPGMLLMVEPIVKALRAAKKEHNQSYRTIYMTPQGKPLNQSTVNRLALEDGLIILAGRYEGIDERIIDLEIDEECSIGDYVISGGELPAMLLTDAVARQCENVLGHADSANQDSFMFGLLDCPHYTRPSEYEGLRVPDVLCSGNHEKIRLWRRTESLVRTFERRPDLFEKYNLSEEEKLLLKDYLNIKKRRIADEFNI